MVLATLLKAAVGINRYTHLLSLESIMQRTLTVLALVITFVMGSQFGAIDLISAQDGQNLPVDMSKTQTAYANFVRVTSTPEEMLIDFGLNIQNDKTRKMPIEVNQRVVMNYYTAKRMMSAIQIALDRHEKTFGPIETDVRKRMRGALQ
jgi:hypothetical protein